MITQQLLLESAEKMIQEHVDDIFLEALDCLDTKENRTTLSRALHSLFGLSDFPLEISCPYSDSFRSYARSQFAKAYKESCGMTQRSEINEFYDRLSEPEKLEVYISWLKGGDEEIKKAIELQREVQIEKMRKDITRYFANLKDGDELRDWYHEIRPYDGGK